MNYRETTEKLAAWRQQIAELRQRMRDAQASVEPEPVREYEFTSVEGRERLSQLFGDKRDLFVIHNMGRSCPALHALGGWVQRYLSAHRRSRGLCRHQPRLARRAACFAAGRGWRFPMVSHQGTSFAADMGYRSETGGWLPGVSVFRRDGNRILRVADTGFEPSDDFCAVWHLFDLLPEGADGWRAKFCLASDRGSTLASCRPVVRSGAPPTSAARSR